MRDHPAVVLARHFFASLFHFGVLSEDGADALKRVLLGGLALAIALGLLLTRVFMAKYAAIAEAPPEVYARLVVADHAFLIAVPMWLVAAALAVVGQSIFPDETDFRILMAEPLSRLEVFAAKLAALLLFAGLCIVGSHAALVPLTVLTLLGALKAGAFLSTAAAVYASSLAASVFAAFGIVAIHGVLVLLAARGRLLAFSGAVRIALIGGLVVALPLVARLPATASAFDADAWWLAWAPPAWFVGLERWLLGDVTRATLAARAVVATVSAMTIASLAYLRLYHRFDRVTFQSAAPAQGRGRQPSLAAWCARAPVRGAAQRFVALTIRRSVLHQGLVVGLVAGAASLALNGLLGANWGAHRPDAPGYGVLVATLMWASTTMMFLSIPATRLALSVPLELRANWIFRVTEDVDGRAEVADAGVRAVLAWSVALPIAVVAPMQWWLLGPGSLAVLLVEAAIGWLLAEYLMADFRRVPFTCSYIPGKGFVPQMCVKAFAAYVIFTVLTGFLLRASLSSRGVAGTAIVAFGVAAILLGRRRRRHARETGLIFDDQLPSDVTPLRLNAD